MIIPRSSARRLRMPRGSLKSGINLEYLLNNLPRPIEYNVHITVESKPDLNPESVANAMIEALRSARRGGSHF